MVGAAYTAKVKYSGEIAEQYVAKRTSEPNWIWEQEQVRAWAARRRPGSSVLDVPFGTGRYVPIYREARLEIHGCDISADMIAVARRELGEAFDDCQVEVADAEDMRHLGDAQVDAIVCSRFIQWLPDIGIVERVLAEFSRVARDELLLQLRAPAAEARKAPSVLSRIGRSLSRRPSENLRRLGRRLRRDPSTDWKTYAYREHEIVERARAYGWRLASIGRENPHSAGVRFYTFRKGD